MWRAIGGGLVVGLIVLGVVIVALASRPRPTIPRPARDLLDEAARVMGQMHIPSNLDQVDVLSDRSKQATKKWLDRYNKEFKK